MKWEEVLQRDDIIGGELETQEAGSLYRGPIGEIKLEGGTVYITSPWMAKMSKTGWKAWDKTSCSVGADCEPKDIGSGRLWFNMPMLGFGVIYPKGGSRLDPDRVEGL